MATTRIKYRSGLEKLAAGAIERAGLTEFEYEKKKLPFVVPAQKRYYLPDWCNEDDVILETKGRLTSQDRKKMLLVKEQHPEKIIIMIFGQPRNRLSKKSPTTYAAWCEKFGILWCDIDDFVENPKKCLSILMKKQMRGKPKTLTKKKKPQ